MLLLIEMQLLMCNPTQPRTHSWRALFSDSPQECHESLSPLLQCTSVAIVINQYDRFHSIANMVSNGW